MIRFAHIVLLGGLLVQPAAAASKSTPAQGGPRTPVRIVRPVRSLTVAEHAPEAGTGGDSRPYERHLWRAESRFGVAADLLRAVIRVESNFDPKAVSPAGAKGLMQLMPMTARACGVRNIFDPSENILGGARYLSELASGFRGDLVLTLAAYHAGPTNVVNRGGVLSSMSTRAYVSRVLAEYARLRARRLNN